MLFVSPGRDLPAFEDESDLLGGGGMGDEEAKALERDNKENDYRPMPNLDRYKFNPEN